MSVSLEIPKLLAPSEGFGGIGAFRLIGIFDLVDAFAKEFQIDQEIAFASMLAGLGHSLGGAFAVDSTFGVIRPPFSLLLVTPNSDALWPRIPVRFLVDDFESTMRAFTRLPARRSPQKESGKDDKSENPEVDGIELASEVAKDVYADRIAERITSPSLAGHYPRVPFDHHVLLTTPPVGLRRSFRQLSPDQKIRLESALSSNEPLRPGAGEVLGAAPSFYWQIERNEASKFFEENPWFAGLPFLVLATDAPGAIVLNPDEGRATKIQRLCLDLFVMRHQAMSQPRFFTANSKTFRALQEFLAEAQRTKSEKETASSLRPARVVELAFRFALLFTILDRKAEPDQVAALFGLELAKRLYARHLQTLGELLPIAPSQLPNTAELTERERAVFLRICDRPGLSRSELTRSFSRMLKGERDEILAQLIGRRLIDFKDGRLYQQMAPAPS